MMTHREAYYIASQWGSYMKSGDPGGCFYAFHTNDARPITEEHRRNCIDYIDRTLASGVNGRADRIELGRLRDYFLTAPLYSKED